MGRKRAKFILSLVLSIAMLISQIGVPVFVQAADTGDLENVSENKTNHDISGGDLEITNEDNCSTSPHMVTGKTTQHKIVVNGGMHFITLENVNISFDDGAGWFTST